MKNKVINIGIALLFIVGLTLIFINPIRDALLKRSAKELSLEHYTAEQLKGVANSALAVGAGTMKPDQKLGIGNYALAAHYFEGRDVLFGPLYNATIGDSVYVTDLDKVYEYRINHKETIAATDVHVIDDTPGQTKLTLIRY